ncbi:multidrug efflux SMR transporter [Halobacillus salinarum]|uniref:Multidrug efflux SMR transporter n=1 Tax=Halobacillus salinarum TaxID=2932257 RepID=A0ABY4EJJ0_9BACI|nr:multidrug efflux SMR transporter [Halobacillus salinarum]UOQ43799.1 multidrug efflux SMR transporter [Halobacillus salinarum]
MAWVYLLLGAGFEIGWAIGLKLSEGFSQPIPSILTVICLFISFYFFTKSLRRIEIGTGYAIFTGIGAAGTAIIDMAFLGDEAGAGKVFFIGILVFGIIGLKLADERSANAEVE